MKKKILFVSTLAIAILFLFSGCDQILEAMFPDETGGGEGGGGNTIEINVRVSKNVPDYWAADVVVELREINGKEIDGIRRGYPYDPEPANSEGEVFISFTFNWLPDGEYKASAWLDFEDDTWWSAEEPGATVQTQYGDIFPMPFDDWDTGDTMTYMVFDLGIGAVAKEPVRILGPQFINYADKDNTYGYRLWAVKENSFVKDFNWRLEWADDGTNWGQVFGGDYFALSFYNVSYDASYLLVADNIILGKDDGGEVGPIYRDLEINIIEEATPSSEYVLTIDSWGFDGPPFNLPWEESFDVQVQLYNSSDGLIDSQIIPNGLNNGGIWLTSDGSNLGPNFDGRFVYPGIAAGLDRVRVYVDVNHDSDYYGEQDIATEWQVGVDMYNYTYPDGATEAWLGIPPHQYLKIPAFNEFLGMADRYNP